MAFQDDIAGFTAAEIKAAFPGIPRSTVSDWMRGTRWPVHYLQPLAVAHLHQSRKASKPAKKASEKKG